MKKKIDDSKEIIDYYKNILSADETVFNEFVGVMECLSDILKSSELTKKSYNLFYKALTSKNEILWYEAGSRLAQLWDEISEVKELFNKIMNDSKAQARFNIVSLCKFFPDTFQEEVVANGIMDKSAKVRVKTIDMILRLQKDKYLNLLEKHSTVETSGKVKDAIQFTLKNFGKVKVDEDGSLILGV